MAGVPTATRDLAVSPGPGDYPSRLEGLYPRVYRLALVMTGNPWDAEDLAQETILQALSSIDRFSGNSRLDTWVFSIAMNLHRRRVRSAGRCWRRWLVWLAGRPQRDLSPDQLAAIREWKNSLWNTVNQLPEAQRQVVVLRCCEGFSYEEISQVLGCPLGTVKSRWHYAVAALRQKIHSEQLRDFRNG